MGIKPPKPSRVARKTKKERKAPEFELMSPQAVRPWRSFLKTPATKH